MNRPALGPPTPSAHAAPGAAPGARHAGVSAPHADQMHCKGRNSPGPTDGKEEVPGDVVLSSFQKNPAWPRDRTVAP